MRQYRPGSRATQMLKHRQEAKRSNNKETEREKDTKEIKPVWKQREKRISRKGKFHNVNYQRVVKLDKE